MTNFDEIKDKALETLGTIIDKSTEIYNAAEEKAKKLAKIAKIKSEISKNYTEVRKLYADLGSLYYTLHAAAPEDAMAQLCEEIKLLLDKVAACQNELESMEKAETAQYAPADEQEAEAAAEEDATEE